MPRGSVGKRVARAAATGGGRVSTRRNTPWSWYISMAVIVVLGTALVGWSRHQKFAAVNAAKTGTPPTLYDHWHEAFAFDICGTLEANPPQNPDLSSAGLHTHGDGNIHIEPQSPQDTGHNATLGRFVSLYPGMQLTSDTVQYPGLRAYHNGDKCGSKTGYVQVYVWDSPTAKTGHLVKGNPASLLLKNGQMITIGFLPKGATIPKPPALNISNLLQNMSSAQSNGRSMNLPPTVTTVPAHTPATTSSSKSTATTKGP
ncbi:MAG TPA: hypothetical protein VFA11_07380 [Acidimicrobiales bacterium]|nr:hypothetical protein [Acidimicrobiales bacterium]